MLARLFLSFPSYLYLLEEAAVRSSAVVFVMYVTSEHQLKVH